jgi:UDP-N-acetylmuramate dehydrogenase
MTRAVIDHSAVSDGVPLGPFTTYRVGGNARWFAEPMDLEELRSVLKATPKTTKIVVLGRGSNVVVSDKGIDGLVVRLGGSFAAVDIRDDGSVVCGGALPLPQLARAAAAAGRSGLGFYVGIPGSVGGAVRMNAGGHGSDTAAVLTSIVVVDTKSGELSIRSVKDLALTYRSSNVGPTEIVVQATFHTESGDTQELEDEIRSITRWRKDNQPGGTYNAGSVFRNPPDQHSGAIIDSLGLKGTRIGPVKVSEIHANFMVADSDATAQDIWRFVHTIQNLVQTRTGILLEPEIVFLGAFEKEESR